MRVAKWGGSSVHDESASEKGCKNGKNDSLTEIVKIEECEQGLEDKSHSVYQPSFCSMDKSVVTIDLTTEDNEDSSGQFSKGKQPEISQSDDSFDTLHSTDSSEDSPDNESSVHKRRSYLDEKKSFFDEEDEFLVRKSDDKIYVKDSIWENKKAKHVKKLPYDIDGNTKYEIPYHKIEQFESTKDGRYWGHRSKSRRQGFDDDRFLASCKGSFHCTNVDCPHIVEFNKPNRVQFTPKTQL